MPIKLTRFKMHNTPSTPGASATNATASSSDPNPRQIAKAKATYQSIHNLHSITNSDAARINAEEELGNMGIILTNAEKAKQMLDRVAFVQKQLGKLCDTLADYGTKTAALRDKNRDIAQLLTNMAQYESDETIVKLGLNIIPDLFTTLGTHKDTQVKKIETAVIPILSCYRKTCKYLKNGIKDTMTGLDAEKSSKKYADKLLQRFSHDQSFRTERGLMQLEAAETDYEQKASTSESLLKLITTQMEHFEEERIIDTKKCLMTFLKTELEMHVKSIKILTEVYDKIK